MTTKTEGGLRIGITIGLHAEDESLWNNGIKQNAVYLAEALKNSQMVKSVFLVNTTAVRITPALPWSQERWPTVTFEDAKDNLDLLIELGGQVSPEQTDYLKQCGTRLISYCCGVEYVNAMQSVLFNKPLWGANLFINRRYDAIWMVPQVANISQHYFQTLRRCPAHVVPFIWDPVFLTERSKDMPDNGEYRPKPGPRRLSVMEPNIDVVKFCLYPVLIAEEAYRRVPNLVSLLQVTNTEHLAHTSAEFVSLMNQTDLVREHKAIFLGRHDTAQFLSDNTDVMISHQWENPLNYFYLEVCWQGYPLVHNAHLCQELGYFYDGNNVQAGCQQLVYALRQHDRQWEHYRDQQRKLINRYLPHNPNLVADYDVLLRQLMRQSLA